MDKKNRKEPGITVTLDGEVLIKMTVGSAFIIYSFFIVVFGLDKTTIDYILAFGLLILGLFFVIEGYFKYKHFKTK